MSEQVAILDEDKVYVRKVLAAFYDENFAARFDTVNEEMIEILGASPFLPSLKGELVG